MIHIAIDNKLNSFNELSIEITNKCSLNCIYCSSEANLEKKEYIQFQKLREVILAAKKHFNINRISLSGGETFLYPQFIQLYNFLKSNDFEILIYSSGVTLDHKHKFVPIDTGILSKLDGKKSDFKIILNVQAHNKELVEKINGTPDTFEIIENSIENIKRQKIQLGAHIVPFKYNYKYLEKIVEFCWNKSFDEVNFLRFVPQGRGSDLGLYNTKTEFAVINRTIIEILKRFQNENNFAIRLGHPINFLFLTKNNHLYQPEEPHHCRGGVDAPLIMANGDVSMCPAWKDLKRFHVGNVYKQDFDKIWINEKFTLFRNFIEQDYRLLKDPCGTCEYLELCRGKCVAQRLLSQKSSLAKSSLKELIFHAPDPQCFKNKQILK